MPVTPNPSKKGKKILYQILGKPANIASKPTAKQKQIDKDLNTQARFKMR